MANDQKGVNDMTPQEYGAHKKELLRGIEVERLKQVDERANQAAFQKHQPTNGGNTK